MTFLQKRKFTYYGLIFTIIAITTTLAISFLRFYEETHLSYSNDIQHLHQIEQNAVNAQYYFKRQVQEWKNILLRGKSPADFNKYKALFAQEFENTQNAMDALHNSIDSQSEVKSLSATFLQTHRAILSEYSQALEIFKQSGYDPTAGDAAVRGIDRRPTQLLDQISQLLEKEVDVEKSLLQKKLDAYIFAFGSAFIFIQAFFCWILVRLTSKLLRANLKDKVTSLGNRELFINTIKDLIRQQKKATIIVFDINNFKLMNEAFGNKGGDLYLRLLSQTLNMTLATKETICRVGSDMFGLILFTTTSENMISRVNDLRNLIRSFEYKEKDISLSLTANAGIYCMKVEDENCVEQLLNKLYASLQESKSIGPGAYTVYSPHDNRILSRQAEMQNVSLITKALMQKRILLYRQEIRDINNENDKSYYEILLRMQGEDGEILPPGLFLQAAERFHLMVDIDKYMVKSLIEYLSDTPNDAAQYSVNLSGATLSDAGFIQFIEDVFEQPNLTHKQIGFEITESDIIRNFDIATGIVNKLKSYGCQISLDDFGTGMSSYGYISKLPIDTLKIDGMFINDLNKQSYNRAIIRSITQLAKDLSIKTVAEFVETEEELSALKELNIDFGQGYLIHKPEFVYQPLAA
ncbi:EAL domain-containing protein [Agaribacter marinus]|uniref:Diguanylate cyclase (GGDEF) domain-containing protein n=1 Tax=Agaribacter marinus TaxID=1431249 RepID=A0AA37SZL1_9ALTE|nr:bifunctional diguanylate cyclase/phosphodiesterase [Agaribacter marinus]GLR72688.1 hypothetical protein GCM10007852_35960 [Agaribacter marinus]